ncbi:alpha-tubulin suppressor-like RCC1 family protein [Paenibacillus castaneae]|uniref:S-layer homology domain-containing protein n=1 Tax=Paenibacillus TaxID=44249 RepID=UPI001390ADB1|nr:MULTISPECIES: S-layer homology domain-containing protein [Paenibacillus]NIK80546.1 alpha-tubulin suppressor-like RCC1 family protein [Paenibacillus castaneae]
MKKHLLFILALVVMFAAFATSASAATSVTIKKISSSPSHQLFLKSDGTVWARGLNSKGQLGDGTTLDRKNPIQIPGLTSIIDIVAGDSFSMFLASNGDLFTVGDNQLGQLGIGKADPFLSTPAIILQGVSSIATVDGSQGLALKDGNLYQWGDRTGGSPGLGMPRYNYFYPINVQYPVKFTAIKREFLLAENGDLYEFTLDKKDFNKIPVSNVKEIFSSHSDTFLLLNDGSVFHRKPDGKDFTIFSSLKDIVEISMGSSHFLARDKKGDVWSWGDNTLGQVGIGKISESVNSPTKVLSNATMISTNQFASFAITNDNTIYVSGSLLILNGTAFKNHKFTKWLSPSAFGLEGSVPMEENPPKTGNGDTPKPDSLKLTDIKGHWAEKNIQALLELGIVKGFSNQTFQPNAKVTREEFVKMLVESLKLEKTTTTSIFKDVPETRWSNPFIATAIEHGILSPDEIGDTFSPTALITRFEMAVAVGRALGLTGQADLYFSDEALITTNRELVSATVESKIINGFPDGTFRPSSLTTRAEAVTVIIRLLHYTSLVEFKD